MQQKNNQEQPVGLGSVAISSIASSPLLAASGLSMGLGFLLQLVFWVSIGEMPQLDFDAFVAVFAASAIVGAVLFVLLIFPLFVPAIVWLSLHDEYCAIQRANSVHDGGDGEPERQWQKLIFISAGIGGIMALIIIVAIVAWGSPPHIVLLTLSSAVTTGLCALRFTGEQCNWTASQKVRLFFLATLVGFGGISICIPMGILAKMVAQSEIQSPYLQFLSLIIGTFVFLFLSLMLAFRRYSVRTFFVLVSFAMLTSTAAVLVPLKADRALAQAIARTLGQGAIPSMKILVSAEECERLNKLAELQWCQVDGAAGFTRPVVVLNRQGDPWLIEVRLEAGESVDRQPILRVYIPRDAVLAAIRTSDCSALLARGCGRGPTETTKK